MHILQPKHSKLKPQEVADLVEKYSISISQLPRIKINDSALPEGCESGDIIKIERDVDGEKREYFRVVA